MSEPKMTETDIRRQVQDYLRWRNWFVFYVLQGLGAYRGIPGQLRHDDCGQLWRRAGRVKVAGCMRVIAEVAHVIH